jgi:hypothetical protein
VWLFPSLYLAFWRHLYWLQYLFLGFCFILTKALEGWDSLSSVTVQQRSWLGLVLKSLVQEHPLISVVDCRFCNYEFCILTSERCPSVFWFFFFFFVLQDSTFPPLVAFPFTSQTPMGTPDSCLPSSAERMLAKAVPWACSILFLQSVSCYTRIIFQ